MNNDIVSNFFKGKFIAYFDELQKKMQHVKAFVLDWDGVFNNGHKHYDGSNTWCEIDSVGISMMRLSYYLKNKIHAPIAIISGEKNKAAFNFAQREHFNNIFFSIKHKETALRFFCGQYHLQPAEIMFVFDDVLDLSASAIAGVRVMVQHSCNALFTDYTIRNNMVDYITANNGNNGAVRETSELYMFANENFDVTIDHRVEFNEKYQTFMAERNQTVSQFYTAINNNIIQQNPQ